MNRNTIYNYLKNIEELKVLFHRYGKGYYVEFVPNVWTSYSEIYVDDLFIENFYSIKLFIQKIVVQGEVSDMEIHINYKDIKDRFVVYLEEGYKVKK